MGKGNTPHIIELSVPVYAYAKRVLQYLYGENLKNEKLKIDFLIGAGNLITQTHRSDKVLPTKLVHNIPIEIIEIREKLPERIFNFIRLYDKEYLAYALGNYYNKKAKDILFTSFLFLKELNDSDKKSNAIKTLEFYNIEPSELDYTSFYRNLNRNYE